MALSVKEIMDLDLDDVMKMGLTQLQELNRILNSAANKRIKRYQQAKEKDDTLYSQVIESRFKMGKGKFTSANTKALNDARKRFFETRAFLSSQTATLKGARESSKKFKEFMGNKGASKEEIKEFEKLFNEVLEIMPEMGTYSNGRSLVAQALQIAMDNGIYDPVTIKNHFNEILNNDFSWVLEREDESPEFDGEY